ncbi:MAG: DUF3067 family protein [Leptolyngbyaceae cyanobacterium SM1_1_3]|nr:DUF3067 family protein [Leptolyngbyaceae cyanobacterium SM1_1_3]NJN03835.1 DUF3067 family protein [Leptolyngbyaceae cyanobacterium RM1_1_2]NJO08628.1 DUF3067 family protein [Leptolyngbyaceae cyanobacterium SL_1_1]
MTGQELQELLLDKWGYSFDIQLRQAQGKVFVQVMWRYLEQASFPMDEVEYLEHLDDVATHLEEWGSVGYVRQYIEKTQERPRLGKAVSIPIDLGERASEWLISDF